MARLFLAHASADTPTVHRLADALREAGHDPWVDEDRIDLGDSIPSAIERGLREADFVIVCLSAAAQRGWVQAERDAAFMQQMRDGRTRILPVRLEDIAPPYLLQSIASADLFPDAAAFGRAVRRLLRAIAKHTDAVLLPMPEPAGPTESPGAATAIAPPPPRAPLPPAPPTPTFEPSPPGTVDLFFSHAPSDASLVAPLEMALTVLRRQKRIRILHGSRIAAGLSRDAELQAQLASSRIVLVFLSSAYLASDDCEREMTLAVERQRAGATRLIPILVRDTADWRQTPLGSLMPLPRNGVPIERCKHPDEIWTDIAGELRAIVDHLLTSPDSNP